MNNGRPKYRRIILKVTGEIFAGPLSFGIDAATVKAFAEETLPKLREHLRMAMALATGNPAL